MDDEQATAVQDPPEQQISPSESADAPASTPAEVAQSDPPATTEPTPAEIKLSRETLSAILQTHESEIAELPEFTEKVTSRAQSLVDTARQQSQADFTLDNEWQGIQAEYGRREQAHQQSLAESAALLGKFNDDPDSVTPQQVAAATLKAVQNADSLAEFSRIRSEREQFVTFDAHAQQVLGAEAETEVAYDGQKISVNDAYNDILVEYNRLKNAGVNKQRRGEPLNEGEIAARRAALPTFVRKLSALTLATGEAIGSRRLNAQDAKAQAAREQLIRDNALRELAANGLGTTTTPAGQPVGGRSDDELLLDPTTPIAKLEEIRNRQNGVRS